MGHRFHGAEGFVKGGDMTIRRYAHVWLAAILVCSAVGGVRAAEEPETVMITLHAKAGAEAELAQVIARHWDTARRLNMVRDTPHLTLRSVKGGQTDFVEIMTWRDASMPDSAPPEIQKIWAEMNRLVETRGSLAGLRIEEMSVVSDKP
jgi:hypothetical protein